MGLGLGRLSTYVNVDYVNIEIHASYSNKYMQLEHQLTFVNPDFIRESFKILVKLSSE